MGEGANSEPRRSFIFDVRHGWAFDVPGAISPPNEDKNRVAEHIQVLSRHGRVTDGKEVEACLC